MKLNKLIFAILFSLSTIFVFAQEADGSVTDSPAAEAPKEKNSRGLTGKIYAQPASFKDVLHSTDFVASMGPGVYFNTSSTTVSAPSPIVYPISFGLIWPNYTFLAFEPTVTFFSMYHLFYDGMALPAEIENRTTQTLSFMINFPIVFSLYYGQNRLQLNAGIALFARIGLKANGVNSADSGYSGTVADDVSAINKWFWKNARCVYISGSASWLFGLTGNLKAGPTASIFLPVGTVFSGENVQGMIVNIGMKISL